MRQRLHALQWRHSAIHREAYDLSGRTQQKAAPEGGFFDIRTLLVLNTWLRGPPKLLPCFPTRG